jgi:pimeloyl-ACP methyl ester carboxylesterase
MAELFEFEEPQPVAASHLLRCRCCVCGAEALAAPQQVSVARCTGCMGAGAASGARVGSYTPGALLVPLRPAQQVVERADLHPPVSVCESNGCEHTEPAPVTALLNAAYAAGWRAVVRHSRGGVMGGSGKQLADAEIWSVRFRCGSWQGYAVRRGDVWDSVCVAGAGLPPFLLLGVTSLREWLTEPDRPPAWYQEKRAEEAARKLAAKIVKCPGPGHCTWAEPGEHTHRGNGDIKPKTSRKESEHGG